MYWEMQSASNPQLSPDGSEIVYTRGWIDPKSDDRKSELWIMDADGERKRFLAEGSSATWSPDGTRIAYLAEGAPGGSQIYIRWMDDEGATSQITRMTQSPSNIRRMASPSLLTARSKPLSISPSACRRRRMGRNGRRRPRSLSGPSTAATARAMWMTPTSTCLWSQPTAARCGSLRTATGTTRPVNGRRMGKSSSSLRCAWRMPSCSGATARSMRCRWRTARSGN
ncbi:MAG: hypothetical protein GVY15_04370, partial [Bacteroidetes bacterium]|nr:hypothetical protein [Bacteroidota bacterium]